MKQIAVISLIILASIGIGSFQQYRLFDLKQESADLLRKTSHPSSEKRERHSPSRPMDSTVAEISSDESLAAVVTQMAGVIEKAQERFSKVKEGNPMTAAENAEFTEYLKRLYESFAALDPEQIFELIQRLKSDSSLPKNLSEQPVRACVEILLEANPKVLLDVMPGLKDYPDSDAVMSDAFGRWLRANPGAAVKWFEVEAEKGSPLTRSMLYSILLEESTLDPSRALSRALANEMSDQPVDIKNLGANIATKLDEVDENLAFFSALAREGEKLPDSALLADIRHTYVGELGRRLYQWPFESVKTLINADFTPAEKTVFAKEVSQIGDLDDLDKWATWISKIPIPADGKHPMEDFFGHWFHFSPAAAGKWLEQMPSGELKKQLLKRRTED